MKTRKLLLILFSVLATALSSWAQTPTSVKALRFVTFTSDTAVIKSGASEGTMFWNPVYKKLRWYDGTTWRTVGDGSSGISVTSVFGRTGAITAQSGDYTFLQIGSKPTTLLGYGITDPIVLTSGSYSNPSWITALAWSKLTGTPTSLSGYGITDPIVLTSGSYSNPSWITALAWSKLTGTPTTISGYGITDPIVLTSGSYSNPSWISSLAWSKITGTPNTISGYGLTDALSTTLSPGHLHVGNGSSIATDMAITGDVSLSSGGVISIGSGKVLNSMLAGSIASSKLIGTDISTVGTITTGTWNASTIGDSYLTTPYVKADGTRAFTGDQSHGGFKITNVKELDITGTAGNGFLNLISQSSDPAQPSSSISLFSNSGNHFSWKTPSDNFTRTFTAGTLTASRLWTLPDVSGTVVLTDNTATLTSKTISGSSNTITNVSLTSGVTGTLPIANGGTNNGSLSVTQGTVYYGDGSKLIGLAPGTSGQVLQTQGAGANPQWANGTGTITYNVTSIATNPAVSQNYFVNNYGRAWQVGSGGSGFTYIRRACTIKIAELFWLNAGTNSTGENISIYIRVNNTTDNLIATVGNTSVSKVFSNTGLSISLSAGDYYEIKVSTPAWSTVPTSCFLSGYIIADF